MRALLVVVLLAGCTEPNPDFCADDNFDECQRAYLAARGWVRAPDLAGFEVVPLRDMTVAPDMAILPPDLTADLSMPPDLTTLPDLTIPPDLTQLPDLWFDRACVGQACPSGCAMPPQEWTCCSDNKGASVAVRAVGSDCVTGADCGNGACSDKLFTLCQNGRCCVFLGGSCQSPSDCCSGKCVNGSCRA